MQIGSPAPGPVARGIDNGIAGQGSLPSNFDGVGNATDSPSHRQLPTALELADTHQRLYRHMSNTAFKSGRESFGTDADWRRVEAAVAFEWGMSAQEFAEFTDRKPAYSEQPNFTSGERTVLSAKSGVPAPIYSKELLPGHRVIDDGPEVTSF